MSTTTSDFLVQIDREIADNTLPPLAGADPNGMPGTAPSLDAQPDDDGLQLMKDSLVNYLTGLQEVTTVIQAICAHHPELQPQADVFMIGIINSCDNLVRNGELLDTFLHQVFEMSELSHNGRDTHDDNGPPDDPHDDEAWARFVSNERE